MKRCLWMMAAWTLVMGGVAQADLFVNPPETYWSPPWWDAFPYQRNIYWDFNSVSPVGGPSRNGTPGAVYEGVFDRPNHRGGLKSSDTVTVTGGVQWYPTESIPGETLTGVVGVDNRGGDSPVTGTIVFHLDNVEALAPSSHKEIWIEDTSVCSPAGYFATVSVVAAGAAGLDYGTTEPISGSSEVRDNYGYIVIPNPLSEDVVYTFNVPAGGYDFLDTLHIATECSGAFGWGGWTSNPGGRCAGGWGWGAHCCIPEPSPLAYSTVLGALVLIGYVWRRRRAMALTPAASRQ